MRTRSLIVVLAVLAVAALALAGCNGNEAEGIQRLLEYWQSSRADVVRGGGTGPESIAFTAIALMFPSSDGTQAATAAVSEAQLTATTDADTFIHLRGTYTQDADGIHVELPSSALEYDGTMRQMTLELSNPTGDGKIAGTMTYTRGDSTYEGNVEFSPAEED